MKINLDYGIKLTEKEKELKIEVPSNAELTFDYISQAVTQKYKDGIDGSLRRMWGRIQRKFDVAIEKKTDTVELEQAEQDFIKKCMETVKFMPVTAKYISVLEDEIASWK